MLTDMTVEWESTLDYIPVQLSIQTSDLISFSKDKHIFTMVQQIYFHFLSRHNYQDNNSDGIGYIFIY